jgi:hypothetical protein
MPAAQQQALDRVEVRVRAEAIRLRRRFVKLMLIRLECTAKRAKWPRAWAGVS